MAFNDMREFLAHLEKEGELKRIKAEVDKDWEISTIARKFFLERPPEKRPALIFDKVKGFKIPVVVSVFGSRRRYALALETTEKGINDRWVKALKDPIEPRIVPTGPCKENIMLGDEVDLGKFPIPIWTPPKDVGPYITSGGCVTRDPETKVRNVGTYRLQIKGKNKTGLYPGSPEQHIAIHHQKYERMNKPMDIAVVLGPDPYVPMCQVTRVPLGVDEFAVAGGLKGEPIDLVKCETVDLEVPASSEIVIEGEVPAHIRESEAPFGETSGFMSPRRNSEIINVKAITYRNNAAYHCFISQKPPSESTMIKCIGAEGTLYWDLVRTGVPGIVDVYCPEPGSNGFYIVVAIKKSFPGHARQVFYAIWSAQPMLGKYIIVCDDDIDIRNPFDVEWALTYRCDPARDSLLVSDASGAGIDPTRSHSEVTGKIGLDATIKRREDYDLALPDPKYFEKVNARWKEYGID